MRPWFVPLLLLFALTLTTSCVASPPTRSLVGAAAASPSPYLLPFEAGTPRVLVQGGPGPFSHSGSQRYALDFAMPVGTPILAARDGTVAEVKEDSDSGGPTKEHAKDGNYVYVQHTDGTQGVYLHLRKNGADVAVGDAVRQGQVIGRSGNTGWSSLPHLHFELDQKDPKTGRWTSLPVRFADVKGDGVPQMMMWYRSGNVRR